MIALALLGLAGLALFIIAGSKAHDEARRLEAIKRNVRDTSLDGKEII
jgi:hypothetical protein